MPPSFYAAKSFSLACPLPPFFLKYPGQMSDFFWSLSCPLILDLILTLPMLSHLVELKLNDVKRPPLPWKSIPPISCTISEEDKETAMA